MRNSYQSQCVSRNGAVWVIVPVHNRRGVTRACLVHLLRLGIPEWAVIAVIDDGSCDGTAEMMAVEFPWVRAVEGNGALWWGGAIRLGMEMAAQEGAECVVWLNDDTLPKEGSLEMLVQLALARAAITGGVCETGEHSGFSYGGGLIVGGWPKAFNPMPSAEAETRPVDWLHGNMVAVPAKLWQQIGFPVIRWAKHHFADAGYTLQARRAGHEVLLVPAATGLAEWNDSGSYLSWADPRLSGSTLMRGLWNPKMWWYLPGVAWFQVRFFGMVGLWRMLWLTLKVLVISFLKCLPTSRVLQLIQRTKRCASIT